MDNVLTAHKLGTARNHISGFQRMAVAMKVVGVVHQTDDECLLKTKATASSVCTTVQEGLVVSCQSELRKARW